MTSAEAKRTIIILGNLVIRLPIWFYITYKLLEGINASELVWFMFWVYIPVLFILEFLQKLWFEVFKD